MAILKKIEKIPKIETEETKVEIIKEVLSSEKNIEKKEEKNIEVKDEILVSHSQNDSDEEELSESQIRSKKIDDILAFGLNDIFLTLSPEKQHEFKVKGEETRDKINILFGKAKINVGKIIFLIKKWLSVIPTVNRFFLEQEAKIKADKIIKLKKY